MNSCELATLVATLSCGIFKCVPREELPLVIAVLSQIAATLATIAEEENLLHPEHATPALPPSPASTAEDSLFPISAQGLKP